MKFAIFDTETTGLVFHPELPLDQQPEVIEFGGLVTDGEEILKEINFLIKPHGAISNTITRITGIKQSDVDHLDYMNIDYMQDIADFFDGSDAVIAHNLDFDKSLLTFEAKRLNLKLKDINYPKIEICTVIESYEKFGRRMRLQELYRLYVGPLVQTHRAIDDVKMLFQVCKALGIFEAYKYVNGVKNVSTVKN